MKLLGWILALILILAIGGYAIGTVAHTFYYMIMTIFSKLTFGFMYGFVAIIILTLVYFLIKKK